MTVGAAQALLKTSGLAASRGTVIAGAGPLVWLYAWQCLNAGGGVDAILETTPEGRFAQAIRHLPSFVASRYLAKGLALMRDVRARVRVIEHVERVEALGDERVEGVRYVAGGRTETLACDTLLLHQGVIPHLNLPLAAGCDVAWNGAQLCFEPVVDAGADRRCRACGSPATARASRAPTRPGPRGALARWPPRMRSGGSTRTIATARRVRIASRSRARSAGRASSTRSTARPKRSGCPRRHARLAAARKVRRRASSMPSAGRRGPGPPQVKALTRCGMGPCQGVLPRPT
jgi:hypothetical protein